WLMEAGLASQEELDEIDSDAKKTVLEAKKAAWTAYTEPVKHEQTELLSLLDKIATDSSNRVFIQKLVSDLRSVKEPGRKELLVIARKVLRMLTGENTQGTLAKWITDYTEKIQPKFSSHLFSESENNIHSAKEVLPTYSDDDEEADAR